MRSRRVEKAAEAVREVVSWAILTELSDPRVKDVTVTHVEVLWRHPPGEGPRVDHGGRERSRICACGACSTRPVFFNRSCLLRIDTRYTPRIEFVLNQGVKRSIEVSRILKVLPKPPEEETPEADDEEAPDAAEERTAASRMRRTRKRVSSHGGDCGVTWTSGFSRLSAAIAPPYNLIHHPSRTRILSVSCECARPMATSSRSAQFAKLHKVLKKYYKPVSVSAERPTARAFDLSVPAGRRTLRRGGGDVRDDRRGVAGLERDAGQFGPRVDGDDGSVAQTPGTAGRLKRILQHVFRGELLVRPGGCEKNLGPACDALKKLSGTTPFAAAYVVQSAFGGHSIPLDTGTIEVMRILGMATDKEVEERSIARLERAVPRQGRGIRILAPSARRGVHR